MRALHLNLRVTVAVRIRNFNILLSMLAIIASIKGCTGPAERLQLCEVVVHGGDLVLVVECHHLPHSPHIDLFPLSPGCLRNDAQVVLMLHHDVVILSQHSRHHYLVPHHVRLLVHLHVVSDPLLLQLQMLRVGNTQQKSPNG